MHSSKPLYAHIIPQETKNIVKTWRVDAMTNDHGIQIHLLPLSTPVFPEAASAAGLAEAEQNGRTGQRGDHREVQ